MHYISKCNNITIINSSAMLTFLLSIIMLLIILVVCVVIVSRLSSYQMKNIK